MITEGKIVTLKDTKAHELLPFKPGETLRVVRVSKFKTERKRVFVETIDQSRASEVYPSHLRQVDMLEVDGRLRSMEDWAADCGIKVAALKERIRYGWTFSDAVSTPKGKKPKAP